MVQQALVCIGCPMGCHVTLQVGEKGDIEKITGHECKEGRDYILSEFLAPVRVFTATVLTEKGRPLPVRTDRPIHKSQLKKVMGALARVRLAPPVRKGEVIIHNILGTGANLVATSSLPIHGPSVKRDGKPKKGARKGWGNGKAKAGKEKRSRSA